MRRNRVEAELELRANLTAFQAQMAQGFRELQAQLGKGIDLSGMEGQIRNTINLLDQLKNRAEAVYRDTAAEQRKLLTSVETLHKKVANETARMLKAQGIEARKAAELTRQAFSASTTSLAKSQRKEALTTIHQTLGNVAGYGNVANLATELKTQRAALATATKDMRQYGRLVSDVSNLSVQALQRVDAAILLNAKSWDWLEAKTTKASMASTKVLEKATKDTAQSLKMLTKAAQDGSISSTRAIDRIIEKLRKLAEAEQLAAASAEYGATRRARAGNAVARAMAVVSAAPLSKATAQRAIERRSMDNWRIAQQTRVWGHQKEADTVFGRLATSTAYGGTMDAAMEKEALAALNRLKLEKGQLEYQMRKMAEKGQGGSAKYQQKQILAEGLTGRVNSYERALEGMRVARTAQFIGQGKDDVRGGYLGAKHQVSLLHAQNRAASDAQFMDMADHYNRLGTFIAEQEARLTDKKSKLSKAERATIKQNLKELRALHRQEELEMVTMASRNAGLVVKEEREKEAAITNATKKGIHDRKVLRQAEAIAFARTLYGNTASIGMLDAEGLANARHAVTTAGRLHLAGGAVGPTGTVDALDEFDPATQARLMAQIRAREKVIGANAPTRWQRLGKFLTGANMGFRGDWSAYGGANRSLFHRINHRITNVSQMMGTSLYGLGAVGAVTAIAGGTVKLAAQIQSAQMGIAGMVRSYGQFVDLQGKSLPPAEQLNMALARSRVLYDEIRDTAARSLVTTSELTEGYLSGGPQLSRKGFTQAQILDVTNQVMMLGRLQGLTSTAIMSDLRDFATGNVNVRSQVLRAAGIDKEGLQGAYAKGGAPEAYKYFKEQMAGFQDVFKGLEKTPQGMLNKFAVELQRLGQTVGENLVPILLPKLGKFRMSIEDWVASGKAEEFAKSFGDFVGGVMDAGTSFLAWVSPWVSNFKTLLLVTLTGVFASFALKVAMEMVPGTAKALGGIIAAIGMFIYYLWEKKRQADALASASTEGLLSPLTSQQLEGYTSEYRQTLGAQASRGNLSVPKEAKAYQDLLTRLGGEQNLQKLGTLWNAAKSLGFDTGGADTKHFNLFEDALYALESPLSATGLYRGGMEKAIEEARRKKLDASSYNPSAFQFQSSREQQRINALAMLMNATGVNNVGELEQMLRLERNARSTADLTTGDALQKGRAFFEGNAHKVLRDAQSMKDQLTRQYFSKLGAYAKEGPQSFEEIQRTDPAAAKEILGKVRTFIEGATYVPITGGIGTGDTGGGKPVTSGKVGIEQTPFAVAAKAWAEYQSQLLQSRIANTPMLSMSGGVYAQYGLGAQMFQMGAGGALADWRAGMADAAGKGPYAFAQVNIEFQKAMAESLEAFLEHTKKVKEAVTVQQQQIEVSRRQLELDKQELAIRQQEREFSRLDFTTREGAQRGLAMVGQMASARARSIESQTALGMLKEVTHPMALEFVRNASPSVVASWVGDANVSKIIAGDLSGLTPIQQQGLAEMIAYGMSQGGVITATRQEAEAAAQQSAIDVAAAAKGRKAGKAVPKGPSVDTSAIMDLLFGSGKGAPITGLPGLGVDQAGGMLPVLLSMGSFGQGAGSMFWPMLMTGMLATAGVNQRRDEMLFDLAGLSEDQRRQVLTTYGGQIQQNLEFVRSQSIGRTGLSGLELSQQQRLDNAALAAYNATVKANTGIAAMYSAAGQGRLTEFGRSMGFEIVQDEEVQDTVARFLDLLLSPVTQAQIAEKWTQVLVQFERDAKEARDNEALAQTAYSQTKWMRTFESGFQNRMAGGGLNAGLAPYQAWQGAMSLQRDQVLEEAQRWSDREQNIDRQISVGGGKSLYQHNIETYGADYYTKRYNARVQSGLSGLSGSMTPSRVSRLQMTEAAMGALSGIGGELMSNPYGIMSGRSRMDWGAISPLMDQVKSYLDMNGLGMAFRSMGSYTSEQVQNDPMLSKFGVQNADGTWRLDRWAMMKSALGNMAGQFGGQFGGQFLGQALFPGKNPAVIGMGASLGTAAGAMGALSSLGIAAGPWGAVAGGLIGGLLGGLFGGGKPSPEEQRRRQLERQHQKRLEELLSRIDKSLRPQADYFRTIKGDVLYGTASRWYSGRAYASLGLQGALSGR